MKVTARERDERLRAWAEGLRATGRYRVLFGVGGAMVTCLVCGARVDDTDLHDSWHAAQSVPH